jgi:dTDP-4-amino-4,6-dideoxygalactose transaminase
VLAALLWAQLDARELIFKTRRRIWETYDAELAEWAGERGIRRPTVPAGCEPAWSGYHLVFPDPAGRDALIADLRRRGILAVFHYLPLHLSPMGQQWGGQRGRLPVTEWVSDRLVRLPFYNDLDADTQQVVIDAILDC